MTTKFPRIETELRRGIEQIYPASSGKVGGDLPSAPVSDFYIWLGLTGGSADQLEGNWVVDIDVFAPSYSAAMDASLELEALLVGPRPFKTGKIRIDNCYQNEAPRDRPWPDETMFRVGATYVLTARRSSSSA